MSANKAVQDKIAELIAGILKRNGIDHPVDIHADLVSQGVTSVDMVHLMLAIEAAFDLTIPNSGLTPENFRSVSSIETMLAKLQSAETMP
jgi:acyl carrier protein